MKTRIHVVQGDITKLAVDVIVNAANPSLMGGGGVDGAIHRAAGPALLDACLKVRQQQGDCPTGHAVITLAGALPAKAVVHTVGPVWRGGEQNEDQLLQDAYLNSLRLVAANSYTSVAFPAISTGVYGYPRAAAAEIAVKTVSEFITRHALPEQVYFVCYDEENAHLYERLLTRFGRGAVGALTDEVKRRGYQKALIVTDKTLVQCGVVAKVTDKMDAAGLAWAIYDGVVPNPTITVGRR